MIRFSPASGLRPGAGGGVVHPLDVPGFSPFFSFSFILILESTLQLLVFSLFSRRRSKKAKLGRLGIRSIFYLDNILVLGSTFYNCLANLQKALSLLIEARFIINWKKSSLIPTTNFTFLGMIWDSVEGALSLPQDKLLCLHKKASSLLSCSAPSWS
jgi:hypothetical protein